MMSVRGEYCLKRLRGEVSTIETLRRDQDCLLNLVEESPVRESSAFEWPFKN